MTDLERQLRAVVRGDVRFDLHSRLLYSTDASMYQVEPVGVVVPRDRDDVQAALETTRKLGVAVLPRGGGTSLTGQTVNRALVLDFSRYMNRVLEVNTEELWARVEPGLVQDELNHHVRQLGLLFGPDIDVEPGHAGRHAGQQLGRLPLDRLRPHHRPRPRADSPARRRLPRGLQALTADEFAAKCRLPGLEGQVYREVVRIREAYRDEITAAIPPTGAGGRLQPRRAR